jgi:hypothetical protein
LGSAATASFGIPLSERNGKDYTLAESDSSEIFDCYLHFPADKQEAWQWFKVAKKPNFYLDASGYVHDMAGVLEYDWKNIGPDRVLFGSDFSINDPSIVVETVTFFCRLFFQLGSTCMVTVRFS